MHFYKTNKISDALECLVWQTLERKSYPDSRGFSEDYNSYILKVDGVDANTKVEIYQSIIIWHIVTDLCLHTDNDKNVIPPEMEVEIKVGMPPEMDDGINVGIPPEMDDVINVGIPIMDDEINVNHEKKKMIKVVSDYMMYILVLCPFMLSTGNAEISFEKACKHVKKALE